MTTETSTTSWFSRLTSSLGGILLGFVLVSIGVGLLWWNEGRAVQRTKSLNEGAGIVRSIPADSVNPAYEGQLVHLTGEVLSGITIEDPLTGLRYDGVRLVRDVEMFQWIENRETETRTTLGGGEEKTTTYSYSREWRENEVASERFKERGGHENPPMPFDSDQFYSEGSKVGAFEATTKILNALPASDHPSLENLELQSLAGETVHVEGGAIFVGDNPSSPEVGDIRVTYQGAKPGVVSVVAMQVGNSFRPYSAQQGGKIFLTQIGSVGADEMFATAQKGNRILTWILRGIGMVLLFSGFSIILKPVAVFADVLPLLGSIAGAGISLISFLLALVVGFVTFSTAWLVYRPLLGSGLLAVVIVASFFLVRRLAKSKKMLSQ